MTNNSLLQQNLKLSFNQQQLFLDKKTAEAILKRETHKLVLNSATMESIGENYNASLDKYSKKSVKIRTLRKYGFYRRAARLKDCGKFWAVKQCPCCKSRVLEHKSSCHLAYCPYCSKKDYWMIKERLQPTIDKYTWKPHGKYMRFMAREITLTWKEGLEDIENDKEKLKEIKAKRLVQLHALLNGYRRKGMIIGGVISGELKRNKARLHLHFHIFLISSYLPQKEMSDNWKRITGTSDIVYVKLRTLRNAADYCLKNLRQEPEILPTDVGIYEYVLGNGRRRISTFGVLFKLSFTCSKETTLCPFCNIEMEIIRFFDVVELVAWFKEMGDPP